MKSIWVTTAVVQLVYPKNWDKINHFPAHSPQLAACLGIQAPIMPVLVGFAQIKCYLCIVFVQLNKKLC